MQFKPGLHKQRKCKCKLLAFYPINLLKIQVQTQTKKKQFFSFLASAFMLLV